MREAARARIPPRESSRLCQLAAHRWAERERERGSRAVVESRDSRGVQRSRGATVTPPQPCYPAVACAHIVTCVRLCVPPVLLVHCARIGLPDRRSLWFHNLEFCLHNASRRVTTRPAGLPRRPPIVMWTGDAFSPDFPTCRAARPPYLSMAVSGFTS